MSLVRRPTIQKSMPTYDDGTLQYLHLLKYATDIVCTNLINCFTFMTTRPLQVSISISEDIPRGTYWKFDHLDCMVAHFVVSASWEADGLCGGGHLQYLAAKGNNKQVMALTANLHIFLKQKTNKDCWSCNIPENGMPHSHSLETKHKTKINGSFEHTTKKNVLRR